MPMTDYLVTTGGVSVGFDCHGRQGSLALMYDICVCL